MFKTFQSFLNALEKAGELKRVSVEVDPYLEITEIVTRVARSDGPALLFEKVKGSPYPLAINVLGTMKRIEMALGKPPRQLGEELVSLAQSIQPPSWLKLWRSRGTLHRALSMRTPRIWGRAGSQQIIEPANLDSLPILTCWPEDAGRFLTFGLTLTKHPETGLRNLGLYRLQVHSSTTTGAHWQIQKGGGFHYHEAEKRNQALPMAVVIGPDPYLLMAAIAPLPEGLDEIAFSGFLRGAPTRTVRGRQAALDVPAEAEFILEGEVPPHERQQEGPFGDHFGHYSHAAPYPVFHTHTLTRRASPVFHAAVVGKPPQEDKALGDAMQDVMGPLIRLIRPEVKDLWAYYQAGFHNLLVASVHQRYAKEAMKTALGLLGEGQLSLTKCLIVVDAAVDVRDFQAVLEAVRQHFDSSEDLLILSGVPLDTLDFTSYTMNLGSRMILDATRKPKDKPARKPLEPTIDLEALSRQDPEIKAARLWGGTLLMVQVARYGRSVVDRLVHDPRTEGVKMIAAVSEDVDMDDAVSLLWGLFTRFDCARDMVFTETRLVGPVVRYGGRLGIDATFKPGYPKPLEMTSEVKELVTRRWKEYGLTVSPSSKKDL